MQIEWKDSYCLGDETIDHQHKQLFALANAMFAARDQVALRLCAIQLYRHVRKHFADEEALMKKVAFPGYPAHVESHNRMIEGLNALSQDIAGNCIDIAVVADFLNDWALNHIPRDDAEVARYIHAKVHPGT